MSLTIFGFIIDDAVLCFSHPLKVVNITETPPLSNPLILRDTMSNLLYFLLINRQQNVILESDILHQVWDNNGLRSSQSRLIQVISRLKYTLMLVGVKHDFIERVSGKGYRITSSNIKTLYKLPNIEVLRQKI
ncbi:winged helix-turn-helix domain-containing protein [Klebsiella huaxiensis]|uniref:winged helix-turn-helix domain-containing protein n=1 Tax=Klebsiella huaxiensis TaxID=2153354 RepID=UPI0031685AB5